MTGPLVEQIVPCPPIDGALRCFADLPGLVLLDSALLREPLGRYSFLAADPFETIVLDRAVFGENPLAQLGARLQRFRTEPVPDLPPFQGGAAGLLGYELGGCFEKVRPAKWNEFELPDLAVGIYDWVIAWDHSRGSAWIISHGFPETDEARRSRRAAQRLRDVRGRLDRGPATTAAPAPEPTLEAARLAPQFPAPGLGELTSNFSREAYLRAVEQVIEFIFAGDIFQANLSQRLLHPARIDPPTLMQRLRSENPAPFAGYLAFDDWAVVSASPERFVAVQGSDVETRPIKGTRQRRPIPEADLFTRDELRESVKDQAENVMIVDLLRNDLSRICLPGSVRVDQLCAVETYETVQHLVSQVRGRLEPGRDAWDLFRSAIPGGSITGAPKVRAMEIIAQLEPTVRGPYCGNLIYVGFDGRADSNILIRTFVCRRGWIQCGVGGGIVSHSRPADEYEETLHKAAGMLRALRPKGSAVGPGA